MNQTPPVWQMIKYAVENLNGRATYTEIKKYINSNWENVNELTINAQIMALSVNRSSRTHYPENKKPRISNSQYDILYAIGRGEVILYKPDEHGLWEIFENEFGGLSVRQCIEENIDTEDNTDFSENSFIFPIEANLRDFLIKNLHVVKNLKLQMYIDESGRDGKEFLTDVGLIDILAVDNHGNLFVFELKLSRGADKALGQLLRYMGWVKLHIAKGKEVKGIIVANKMDDKIKYAVAATSGITLYEYEMKFELCNSSLNF